MGFVHSRPSSRSRLLLFVLQGVLVALASTALVARAEPARQTAAAPTTSTSLTSTTTSTTVPPPPPRLYFTTGPEAVQSQLRSLASGGGDERPESGPAVRTEQLSPDGTQIVYSKITSARTDWQCPDADCPYTTTTGAGIAIANRDGSGERLLTNGGYDDFPTWVADDVVLYSSHRREPSGREFYELEMIYTTGTSAGSLTTAEETVVGKFAVAPDRRSVAYVTAKRGEAKGSLVVQDIASGAIRTVSSQTFEALTWSPDGAEIAGWRIPFDRSPFRQEIVSVPAAGGAVRVVYGVGPPPENGPWLSHCGSNGGLSTQVGAPVWSPDSAQLAFTSTAGLTTVPGALLHDIVVVNRDGSRPHTVRHASLACTGAYVELDNLTVLAWR